LPQCHKREKLPDKAINELWHFKNENATLFFVNGLKHRFFRSLERGRFVALFLSQAVW